jgi:Uma2 family endonuclease
VTLATRLPHISASGYLKHEADSPLKHEYLDGQIVATAGAGERHNRIAGNAFFRFRSLARGTPCGVFISDMKLRVEATNAFYYPDVMLVCAEDAHPHYKTRPCVVVEVLSPSTAAIDTREKWLAYRTLPSLSVYLLVHADTRRVDYWQRDTDGGWLQGALEENEVLAIDCPPLKVSLCLDDLYEDVEGLGRC